MKWLIMIMFGYLFEQQFFLLYVRRVRRKKEHENLTRIMRGLENITKLMMMKYIEALFPVVNELFGMLSHMYKL